MEEDLGDLGRILESFFKYDRKKEEIKIEPNAIYKLKCIKNKLQNGGKQKLIYYVYKANEKRYIRNILEVKIPPNTKTNDYIIYKGLGNKVKVEQEAGDLYVEICLRDKKSRRTGKLIKKVEKVKKVSVKDQLTQEDVEIFVE